MERERGEKGERGRDGKRERREGGDGEIMGDGGGGREGETDRQTSTQLLSFDLMSINLLVFMLSSRHVTSEHLL